MLRNIAIIAALVSSVALSAQAADKPIDTKVSEAAEKVCPLVARTGPASREYVESQLERVAQQDLGFNGRETRLLIQKCRNWKQ